MEVQTNPLQALRRLDRDLGRLRLLRPLRPGRPRLLIDWLSVPAGIYFLAVVRSLYRDSLRDWNDGPDEVPPELPTPAAPKLASSPPRTPVAGPH